MTDAATVQSLPGRVGWNIYPSGSFLLLFNHLAVCSIGCMQQNVRGQRRTGVEVKDTGFQDTNSEQKMMKNGYRGANREYLGSPYIRCFLFALPLFFGVTTTPHSTKLGWGWNNNTLSPLTRTNQRISFPWTPVNQSDSTLRFNSGKRVPFSFGLWTARM